MFSTGDLLIMFNFFYKEHTAEKQNDKPMNLELNKK